ncbi:MAG: DUF1801 domain-containing protein [Bacteroidetes bacterium]|jgi:hypothetical protein|nr:DUF1801 domain-containing protein [Bacteroidota bacterium]
MDIQKEISDYIASQPEAKRNNIQALHQMIVTLNPGCQLWFLDGKNSENKVVSNPNIGYGLLNLQYAGGKTKPFYQIGISANTSGISVYIMGLSDKLFLSKTYGQSLGKASISGYCIKFKALKDIQVDVLLAAIKHGFATT